MEAQLHNGWNEWSKYVLKELERLDLRIKDLEKTLDIRLRDIEEKLDVVKDRITMTQVRVAGIGAGVSLLTTVIVILLTNLLSRK